MTTKPTIALALGDPAGIGPEIVLRALADARVRAALEPIVVGDAEALARHAQACGLAAAVQDGRIVFDNAPAVRLIETGSLAPPAWRIGESSAVTGRACRDYALRAIELARAGEARAVIAAPHTEAAVNAAGYRFRGYPGLVAEATGTPEDRVFLMLLSPAYRVINVTLHEPVAAAVRRLSPPLIAAAIHAAHQALQALGIARPHIGVCGVNPHAGEGGLMGDEDAAIVAPAVAGARAEGLNVDGPWPADALFGARRHDAYLAMYHDQGHIPVKVAAPLAASAITIGTPVPFGSVAHGSALDIAGQGRADPGALINALLNVAGASDPARPAGSARRAS